MLPVNFSQGGLIRTFLSYPSNFTDFPSAWGRILDNDWNFIYIYASNPQNNYHIDIFFLKHSLYYEIFGLNSGFSSSCRLTLIVIRLKTFTGNSSWEGDLINTIKKQDQMRSETQIYSLLCLCSLAGLMLVKKKKKKRVKSAASIHLSSSSFLFIHFLFLWKMQCF